MIVRWSLLLSILVLAKAYSADSTGAAPQAALTIEVLGIRSNEGKLRFALYDSRETFTKKSIDGAAKSIEGGKAEWKIPKLKPGIYAIAIYHDENDDDKFNQNFLGIPLEEYGFSNGAKARLGPPSWKKVAFEVTPGLNKHVIKLKGAR